MPEDVVLSHSLDALRVGSDSYLSLVRPDGELLDPVFHEPAQYGTPCLGYAQATLARFASGEERGRRAAAAFRILRAALTHVEQPAGTATLSGVDRETGAGSYVNHRDFFWPALMKGYMILRDMLPQEQAAEYRERLERLDILRQFGSRPPSNWSAVWMSGEFVRIREGLSPIGAEQFDDWLGVFFERHIDLKMGFYHETGHPNSYDLFTRFHLLDLLAEGYRGRWAAALETLLESGLRRSLALQLSDGSLASAYRSTGQSWNDGAQCAYFTLAAQRLATRSQDLAEAARRGAAAAFRSFVRWQRPGGLYSPVANVLPPAYRVGYEGYSFDANYGALALSFLATAVNHGFDGDVAVLGGACGPHAAPCVHIENDPTFRAVAHSGRYSIHANALPNPAYDAFGIVDITFGLDRVLHFASSVRFLGDSRFINLGIASRPGRGRGVVTPISWESLVLIGPIQAHERGAGFSLKARFRGKPSVYSLSAAVGPDGVEVEEATLADRGYKSLIVPYLRDAGEGRTMTASVEASDHATRVTLAGASEKVALTVDAALSDWIELPYGYENRRGLCSCLRLDLAEPLDTVRYKLAVV